ncbi:MAG TPA: TIGR03564 family F420-dependent LLM class oxidoreductase [Acidimicrobiales bacterium]|jgi:F420-dependent oxidoreductase-like protein|nr:TIGR03564 family F420-dependent LLM class oxidoreductase [Acidimicrobiales bacterium]
MRIGLPGIGSSLDRIVHQAERAEADGFSSLWYASGTLGDPLVGMAVAARATTSIEVGTAIVQTYPCHPMLLAARANATTEAIGTAGRFTLGIGPSHQPVIEGMLGLSYDHPGRDTEEYVQVLAPLLRGEAVSFHGEAYQVNAGPLALSPAGETPVLIAALGPRLLRIAGRHTAGTVTWMANARAIGEHVSPRIRKAAGDAGRAEPRIVAGLPVAVHDDVDEARQVAAKSFGMYGTLPNYQRILERGGVSGPADAAIVGDEASVAAQLQALVDAGVTDVWAAPFPVGDDRQASRDRTRDLLKSLL